MGVEVSGVGETHTSLSWSVPFCKIFWITSSSFDVPNSFSSCDLEAVLSSPCAPCLLHVISLHPRIGNGRRGCDLLAGREDLECVDHLDQRDSLVIFPLLQHGGVLDEDDIVVGAALVVDL
jgi:hypothetical protein